MRKRSGWRRLNVAIKHTNKGSYQANPPSKFFAKPNLNSDDDGYLSSSC